MLEVDGRVAGYGDIWTSSPMTSSSTSPRPGRWDRSSTGPRARGSLARAERVRAFVEAGHELEDARRCARGYRRIRTSYTMEIELDDPLPVTLPDGIELRPYRHEDEKRLTRPQDDAFADHPFWPGDPVELGASSASRRATSNRPVAARVGRRRGRRVSLNYPSARRPGHGWVGTLGVRAPWRRRGLGGALLRSSFNALHARGRRRCGLRRRREPDRRASALRARRHAPSSASRTPGSSAALVRAQGEVPRLPDADGGRDRAGVPVPLVRP